MSYEAEKIETKEVLCRLLPYIEDVYFRFFFFNDTKPRKNEDSRLLAKTVAFLRRFINKAGS